MGRSASAAVVCAAFAIGCVTMSACGEEGDDDDGELVVSAATSLKTALERYGRDFDGATVRYSFAGSDELAAQIRQGAAPDVYAAANTALPEELFAEGLVEKPRPFAANRLVLAVPDGSNRVRSLEELSRPGVTIAIGSPSVPVGSYTHETLARLGDSRAESILSNVRSEEPDVSGIVGKLTQGAVDAGFVYVTDVVAAEGALEAIELPVSLQPSVAYAVAIVEGAENPILAREFVNGLLEAPGAAALRDAGFEPLPE